MVKPIVIVEQSPKHSNVGRREYFIVAAVLLFTSYKERPEQRSGWKMFCICI